MLSLRNCLCLALTSLAIVSAPAASPAKHKAAAAKPVRLPSGPLSTQVAAILADPSVAGSSWGISVTSLDGTPLYAWQDDQRIAPASNTKLFTTAAAFALLPPGLTLETRVIAHGNVTAGTLQGDIALAGSGDPSMSARTLPYSAHTERTGDALAALDALAAQVAATGVRRVTGNVVGDDSAFVYEPYPRGWEWNDLQWEEGAPVSALTVNDNVVYLSITPGPVGAPVLFTFSPDTSYYTVENTARTVASAPGVKPAIGIERAPGSHVVRVWGTLPANSQGLHLALAVEDAAEFAAVAFKQRLLMHGVQIGGAAVARHLPKTTLPSGAVVASPSSDAATAPDAGEEIAAPQQEQSLGGQLLAQRTSPPLAEDLTVTNKVSQNLHAELLLMQLGRETPDTALSREAGIAAERRFFSRAGILPSDVLLRDGSGVSAEDIVTPRAVTSLLRYAATQPWGAAYRETLPVAGEDGTLAARFTKPPLRGQVQAKTGTLSETASLSGYMTAASGRTIVFSVLCDRHLPGGAGRAAIDKIVTAIYASQ